MNSQGVLWKGSPMAGSGLSQAHRTRAQVSLAQTQCTLIGLWSHWTPNRASSPQARAGECAKKCSPNWCVGFWGPQLHCPGCTGDIMDTRWHQPPCHTAGISLNISFFTWTFWLIPGWSKTKICSYSFCDIHKFSLSLGKRLEKHSEMQYAVSHTNSSRVILQELQYWSPRKSPWITGILIKNKRNAFPITNSDSKCWVCAPNRAGKGGCSPKWIPARWSRLPELHIPEPSTSIPSSQSKPHVPEFQQGAPRSRAFPLHQHHHTDNLPAQTVAETIVYSDKRKSLRLSLTQLPTQSTILYYLRSKTSYSAQAENKIVKGVCSFDSVSFSYLIIYHY